MKYERHIFICNNQRDNGRKSCGREHGEALVASFKEKISAAGLKGRIRAQRTGCLDCCQEGPAMVVYPEGVFYGNVQLQDVEEIFQSHILGGKIVERLKLDD